MCDSEGDRRPSIRAIFSNWNEYDAPFSTRLRLAFRNYWIRLRYARACCGNHGEPGC
ncbi:MAG: hypothetical protein WC273_11550 [Dehalococcoidia bacterium]